MEIKYLLLQIFQLIMCNTHNYMYIITNNVNSITFGFFMYKFKMYKAFYMKFMI